MRESANDIELSKEDFKRIRIGDFSLGFRPVKVEKEAVQSTGRLSFRATKRRAPHRATQHQGLPS